MPTPINPSLSTWEGTETYGPTLNTYLDSGTPLNLGDLSLGGPRINSDRILDLGNLSLSNLTGIEDTQTAQNGGSNGEPSASGPWDSLAVVGVMLFVAYLFTQ